MALGSLLSYSLHSSNLKTAKIDTLEVKNLIVDIAKSYENTKEIGKNRGEFIDKLNRFTKVSLGSPYCASFVSYVIDSAGKKIPLKNKVKSALAMKLRNKNTYSAKEVLNGKRYPQAGEVIVWQKGKSIFGHAGIVTKDWIKNNGQTIQANTNKSTESRDGNGIYVKNANIQPFNYFRIVAFTPIN